MQQMSKNLPWSRIPCSSHHQHASTFKAQIQRPPWCIVFKVAGWLETYPRSVCPQKGWRCRGLLSGQGSRWQCVVHEVVSPHAIFSASIQALEKVARWAHHRNFIWEAQCNLQSEAINAQKADPDLDRTAFCTKLKISTSVPASITLPKLIEHQDKDIGWSRSGKRTSGCIHLRLLTSWTRVDGVTERSLRRWIADPELATQAAHWKGQRRVGVRQYRKQNSGNEIAPSLRISPFEREKV